MQKSIHNFNINTRFRGDMKQLLLLGKGHTKYPIQTYDMNEKIGHYFKNNRINSYNKIRTSMFSLNIYWKINLPTIRPGRSPAEKIFLHYSNI